MAVVSSTGLDLMATVVRHVGVAGGRGMQRWFEIFFWREYVAEN